MSVPCEMLLHPELLSNQQLINVIQERHLRVPHIEYMSRDELLDLFHHFCVPFGQRRYRDTARGKILNKNRNIDADVVVSSLQMSINTDRKHSTNERVKPPPDLLSGHIKRIKINVEMEKRQVVFNREENKRKIDFSSLTISSEPAQKKARKLITWP